MQPIKQLGDAFDLVVFGGVLANEGRMDFIFADTMLDACLLNLCPRISELLLYGFVLLLIRGLGALLLLQCFLSD